MDYHLSTIYLKFGVTNRMQAVRVARNLGILPLENQFSNQTSPESHPNQSPSFVYHGEVS